MTLGVTDDQNYSNIANALREMGSGAEDLAFKPSEIPAAIRGLRSIWGTIEGSILDQTDLKNALDGKAAANHNHDSRYYTESEINTKLNGKSNTGHTHDDRYYTESEIDTKLNDKSNIDHTHDERYYTETEIDDKFDESTIIKSASGAIVSFDDGVEAPAGNVTVAIEPVQEGSGDPSPDNVRPITGWTGVNVTRAGKNLYPVTVDNDSWANNNEATHTKANGIVTVHISDTSKLQGVYSDPYSASMKLLQFLPVRTITCSLDVRTTINTTIRIGVFHASPEYIYPNTTPNWQKVVFTTTLPSDSNIRDPFIIYKQATESEPYDIEFKNLQIELGTEAHDYEPYSGQTVEVTFPSEAGTVYGGSLDVSSGVLTVDKKKITIGEINWNIGTNPENYGVEQYFWRILSDKLPGVTNVLSDTFQTINRNSWSSMGLSAVCGNAGQGQIYVYDSRQIYDTAGDFKNANKDAVIIYKLATPITYQLTPQQLTTLLGQNNIWADTGDIAVDYWKNDKLAAVISTTVNGLKNDLGLKRYGVSGVGASGSALTRTFDAVGMVAQVGTDGNNTSVRNDFDTAAPFMRRKCVGNWILENGHAVFHVRAYYGDENYTEDGTMGDYVAVECPRCYYYRNGEHLIISAHQYPGYRPFDIFCRNHNPADTMPFVYLPAYALALKDGRAVSLPDLDNEQGAWWTMMSDARTYDNGALGNKAGILPASVNFYEYALMTVEFAVQDMQSVMHGCTELASADNTEGTFKTLTEFITPYKAGYVAGQYVAITNNNTHYAGIYQATHHVTAVTRCDASGNAASSGSYVKLTVTDLGKTYDGIVYNTTDSFYIGSRPYRTGACNDVSTPSGSPVSNTDGYHPMKYRWRENVYGNQWWNSSDLFAEKVGTGDSDWTLKWYILNDPEDYDIDSTSSPNAEDLASALFTELDVVTAHANYKTGYIKTKEFSVIYPDLWIPGETTGASATTYFCDNAYLVTSVVVRAVRFGGTWFSGTSAGPSAVSANTAVSYASAYYGAHLYIKQG